MIAHIEAYRAFRATVPYLAMLDKERIASAKDATRTTVALSNRIALDVVDDAKREYSATAPRAKGKALAKAHAPEPRKMAERHDAGEMIVRRERAFANRPLTGKKNRRERMLARAARAGF